MTTSRKNTLAKKLSIKDYTLKDKIITPNPKLYYKHMPNGITKALEKKLDTYRSDFVAAAITVNTPVVADEFDQQDDADFVNISGELGASGGGFDVRITRQSGGDDDPTYGDTLLSVTTPLRASADSGSINDALTAMSDAVAAKVAQDD